MEAIEIGWASFYNEGIDSFSKEFQDEMSRQLMSKFDLMMGIENYAENKRFLLLVGLTPLKTMYQNGYAFCLVEVVDRFSLSRTITIYWKSSNMENEIAATSNELSSDNIEFGWCADFDKEQFLGNKQSILISEIQKKALGFECTANFTLYPDISYNFIFKLKPSETDLELIFELLKSNFKMSYVSKVTGSGTKYSAMIDFQGTPIEVGVVEVDEFMKAYIATGLRTKTESIVIN